jgi:hypothetical protein
MRPNPFKCRITPRSLEIAATVNREGEEALQRLAIYDGEKKYRLSQWYSKKMKGNITVTVMKSDEVLWSIFAYGYHTRGL